MQHKRENTKQKSYSRQLIDFIKMARREDYLILDTETTGLHDGEVVSIAIIDAQGGTLLDTLVKPSKPIPDDAIAIHGITSEMVESAPTWGDVIWQVRGIIGARDTIVYNAPYDMMILRNSSKFHGLDVSWSLTNWYCAMETFAEVYGDWNDYRGNYRWQKLTTAAKHYGLSTEGAHGALADCRMTLGIVKAMCAIKEI